MKSSVVTLIVIFATTNSAFGSFGIRNDTASTFIKLRPSIPKSNSIVSRSLALDLEDDDTLQPPHTLAGQKSPVDIVQAYTNAIERDGDYHKAVKYLAADFQFSSPTKSFKTKEAWLRGFPKFHKNSGKAIFQDPIPGAHDKQIIRKGIMRIAMLPVHLVAVYELNDEGEIVTILVTNKPVLSL
jgi:hypothetical protein